MLEGHTGKGEAAVAGQLLNYVIRAVSVELKVKEVEELEVRLAELEAALEKRGERGALMGLRAKVSRLQKALRGTLDCIELADGGRYCFEPEQTWETLFGYWSASLRAVYHETPRPEPPEILRAVASAADRHRAFQQAYSQAPAPWCPLDVTALVERGELTPRPLVAGGDEHHVLHPHKEPDDSS